MPNNPTGTVRHAKTEFKSHGPTIRPIDENTTGMKTDIVFECTECGKRMPKWMGRCPGCGSWNTVVEHQEARGGTSRSRGQRADVSTGRALPITEVPSDPEPRLKTGIEELDRVLGGGLVRRSVILVGGDPGIGKTTLLMQALHRLAVGGHPVLYASGEESREQLKLRAERLGIGNDRFLVLIENNLENVINRMTENSTAAVVLDSVQAVASGHIDSIAGSVTQIRHVASEIMDTIKKSDAACFIVGHVTKDGNIAGPKMLEHMVDTVLSFEGDRNHPYRILRAVKNRFGSASEIGVFEMGDSGLIEVTNPSELFIAERPTGATGSSVTSLMEGSRPILAEIQALTTGPVAGQGRRTCLGTDAQRLALVVAVIEKKLGLTLTDHDIFVNAVGGVRAVEPAADLAVVSSLLSSFTNRPVPPDTVVFGELGLAGEVRRVSRAELRISEAVRLGFRRIVLPASNADSAEVPKSVRTVGVARLTELADLLFDSGG